MSDEKYYNENNLRSYETKNVSIIEPKYVNFRVDNHGITIRDNCLTVHANYNTVVISIDLLKKALDKYEKLF